MKTMLMLINCLVLAGLKLEAQTNGVEEFKAMKYGLFVHYVWWGKGSPTKYSDGRSPQSLDEFADAFDVERFANDLAAWQVEYVIFTAWHGNLNALFPCETLKKWGLEGHSSKRDLLGDILKACNARGIKVLLYTQPRDGHDLGITEQVKTGWGASKAGPDPDWSNFDFKTWNDFVNELYAEVLERYGNQIVGLYLDEGSPAGNSYLVLDYPRLRQTIKCRNPNLIMLQNYYGNLYTCDVGDKEYHHGQEFANHNGCAWPANRMSVATCFASTWFASPLPGTNTVVFSAEDMFRYTVLQAGVNTDGGGVQWASGPYAGGGWETGVEEAMRKVGSYIKPIAVSLKQTHASQAYPTQQGATLQSVTWGVATEAIDASTTYLHVLTPPKDKTLRLGMTANGVVFSKATHLLNGKPVVLQLDKAGYLITLANNDAWDPLDTVIQLRAGIEQLPHKSSK